MTKALSSIPSVDEVLACEALINLTAGRNRDYVVAQVRQAIDTVRAELRAGKGPEYVGGDKEGRQVLLELVVLRVRHVLTEGDVSSLRPAVNATGVILHTGLGRAPLALEALEAVQVAAEHYCNLELDLESGDRGSRGSHVEDLLVDLTGAEAVAVANNNAGAVMLMLNSLARGREVIVSRGQLVEIGGSFRIPDIIEASGARIREVGTTNRTHRRDYEGAISDDTGLILAVQPSNYEVRGFTAEVPLEQLAEVAAAAQLPLAYDLGAGTLVDLRQWGLPHEELVNETLGRGAQVVSFSADKILGGPQAGIIAGRRDLVDRMAKNAMMRALRCDKLILAALSATLTLFRRDAEELRQAHPVLRMLTEPVERVESRALALMQALSDPVRNILGAHVESVTARFGSGSLPLEELLSAALLCRPSICSVEELARRLRLHPHPVVGRISRDELLLDMRTVRDDDVHVVATALAKAVAAEDLLKE